MIQGYVRKPTKFEWCGTTVWLRKLTKADREAMGSESQLVDLLLLTLTNEDGSPAFTDRCAALKYFDENVGEADAIALGNLALQHSGWNLDGVEVQKKS